MTARRLAGRLESPPAPLAPANDAAGPRSLLRFITCGSVDDGKSTLIGRLLAEAGAVPDDTLAALHADSARIGHAGERIDYALLVDGLQAEREQGITIDVAYRYFSTARRAFIVADTPGHEQYTRNMATGAAGAELAIILIDASKGVLPQTRRHSLINALVGVRHVVVAINKVDLVGFDEVAVRAIEAAYLAAVAGLGFRSVTAIPVSARDGDNVAARSPRMPWYTGPTLLGWLETVETAPEAREAGDFVMPVQWVNRPNDGFRGFAGTIAAGGIQPGQAVVALPSKRRAHVARIVTFDGDLPRAGEGQSVTLTLDRDLDISRGDVLVAARQPLGEVPAARDEVLARVLVTAERSLAIGDGFVVRIGTATAQARVAEILHGTDIESFAPRPADALGTNELGLVRLAFDRPLVVAPYEMSRELGALILIDRLDNATAAMGVIVADDAAAADRGRVVAFRRVADRTMTQALGRNWRRDIWPATSWRIGSALLLGLVVAVLTEEFWLGLAAAVLDAVARPLLRFLHRTIWARHRGRREEEARPHPYGDRA